MLRWLRSRLRRRRLDDDLEKELRFHLDTRTQELIGRGLAPDAAHRRARIELGGLAQMTTLARDVRPGAWIDQILGDVRDASRALRRNAGVTATAIALIALVIGGNTSIYSMVHGLLTNPAPGMQADRLVSLGIVIDGRLFGPEDSYPNYLDYATQTQTIQGLTAYRWERFTLSAPQGTHAIYGAQVSAGYFETLGVRPATGRTFTNEESRLDSSTLVAVISHRLWQQQLQGADVLGQTVMLNGLPATIVGVAAPGFRGATLTEAADVWVPLLAWSRLRGTAATLRDRGHAPFIMIGRLAPDSSLSQANAELATISDRLQAAYPDTNRQKRATVLPYSMVGSGSGVYQQAPRFMAIFSIVTLVTLLIVCANVANLMLARAAARQRELAVRQSLGSSRLRIVRALLIEGLLISLAAWAVACLFAFWVARVVTRLIPPTGQGVTVVPDFTPDWKVLAYAMALALACTIAFTIAPAARAWHQELLPWLKAGERSVAQGRSRLTSALVIMQLAFSILLLVCAGLAYRSLSIVTRADLGFEKDRLLLVTINTAGTTPAAADPASFATRAQTPRAQGTETRATPTGQTQTAQTGQAVEDGAIANGVLLDTIRERLGTLPGVRAVTYVGMPPPAVRLQPVQIPGLSQPVTAGTNDVGPGYLQALGVAPLAGRDFAARERARGPRSAVITQQLAETLWPGQSALGRALTIAPGDGQEEVEVVGVAPNAFFDGVWRADRRAFLFLSRQQAPVAPGEITFYVRNGSGTPEALTAAIGRALRGVDARVPIVYLRTMETQLASITWVNRVMTTMLALFAMGAVAIATIGQYAVMAFTMRGRTRDFGIRVALGATRGQIVGLVIREGLRLTAIGLAIGFALSLPVARAIRRLLAGVAPTDLVTYAGVFAGLAIVSLLACYLPARRAARINPVEALRHE